MDGLSEPQVSRCPRCGGDVAAAARVCPLCRYEFLEGYARQPREPAESDVFATDGATAAAESPLDHPADETGVAPSRGKAPRKPLTRRQRWGCASLLVIGVVFLLGLVGLVTSPRVEPYNGVDTDRYATLTCGEWLAAPTAEQAGWAEFDKAVMLRLAGSDAARANIEASSVQDWVAMTKDYCQTEPAYRPAFALP